MKLIIAFILLLMMGCYGDKPADKEPEQIAFTHMISFTESGMRYILFEPANATGGRFVINITKDSLEVDALLRSYLLRSWKIVDDDKH